VVVEEDLSLRRSGGGGKHRDSVAPSDCPGVDDLPVGPNLGKEADLPPPRPLDLLANGCRRGGVEAERRGGRGQVFRGLGLAAGNSTLFRMRRYPGESA
jgi:hypothetical protein